MTKKKEEQIKVEVDQKNPSILIINGKQYAIVRTTTKKIDGVKHYDKSIFKLIDDKEQFKRDKDIVVKAINTKVKATELIEELLKDIPPVTMRRLAKRIEDGKPIKRHYGCIGFKIGDAYVQLID